jgi:hypothetical protein
MLQDAQKKLDQSSDAHKSILLNLSQLDAQTDAVSQKQNALMAWVQNAKILCIQIPQLRDNIDQLKAKEKLQHLSVQKLQETLSQSNSEKQLLLEAQKVWHLEKRSMHSKIVELTRTNANLIQLDDKLRSQLRQAATVVHEICLHVKDMRAETMQVHSGEHQLVKSMRLMEDKLAKAERKEEAILKLQKASDSESLLLYSQVQQLSEANSSLATANQRAETRILSIEAELGALRNESSETEKRLLVAEERYVKRHSRAGLRL